jgi:hypothetical protein
VAGSRQKGRPYLKTKVNKGELAHGSSGIALT